MDGCEPALHTSPVALEPRACWHRKFRSNHGCSNLRESAGAGRPPSAETQCPSAGPTGWSGLDLLPSQGFGILLSGTAW